MKTSFYLDGKKTTKKKLAELIGQERLNRMVKESKETFTEDPLIANDYFLGSIGMLSIKFN